MIVGKIVGMANYPGFYYGAKEEFTWGIKRKG